MSAGLWERLALEVLPLRQPVPTVAVDEPVVGPNHGRNGRASRVVVYAAGDERQVAQQQDACAVHAAEAGLTIAGMAKDAEIGESVGWVSAMAMLAVGDVDGILVDDRVVIPGLILAAVPPAQRRTVPLRRSSGGSR